MKKYLLPIFLFFTILAQAQIVNIPDSTFKYALLEHGYSITGTYIDTIDLNGDGEIQMTEAQAYDGLIDVHSMNIIDVTGVEDFINLDRLRVYSNNISQIDVSNNVYLRELNCRNNNLTTLDISNNDSLVTVLCFSNQITSIDFPPNANLTGLWCHSNRIDSLDFTTCPKLLKLFCFGNGLENLNLTPCLDLLQVQCFTNELTSISLPPYALQMWQIVAKTNELAEIDLSSFPALTNVQLDVNLFNKVNIANGNNNNMTVMNIDLNPNLSCIETDSGFAPVNQTWLKDSLTVYSTDCGYCWNDYEVSQNTLNCSYDVATYNGGTITTDTIIVDSLTNSCGSDSVYLFIVENEVMFVSDTTILLTDSICLGDGITFGGALVTTSGTYYDFLPSSGACDSVVAKVFEVEPALLIELNQNTLYTSRNASDFQWYKDGVAIAGATDSVLVAVESGAYHLDAKVGNCTYSSEAENVLINGLSNFAGSGLQVYPNPNSGTFTIEGLTGGHSLQLYDISGREILRLDPSLKSFDLTALPKGIYFLKFELSAGAAVEKIIIK